MHAPAPDLGSWRWHFAAGLAVIVAALSIAGLAGFVID